MNGNPSPYRGRFAPSPTGALHFGSLVAAVASYFDARRHGGQWLLRIEDIDPPREVPGSADRIIEELAQFGLIPDDEILYQSTRLEAYDCLVNRLLDEDKAFWCGCSRSDIPTGRPYPGTCRHGLAKGKEKRSIRLRVDSMPIRFADAIQGGIRENLTRTHGDFVIRRADGFPAYQLAVVADDAFQGISHVVRGADLLDSTARQVFLQRQCKFASPGYAHVPLVLGKDGKKLSKQRSSDPVANQPPAVALRAALAFLGHEAPKANDVAVIRAWAVENWDLGRIGVDIACRDPQLY